jgi:glycosyltransferase involved in cell wall biosynthesis
MKPSISLVIPTFNDSRTIEKVVTQAISIIKKITRNYEIIALDDKSPDQTLKVLKKISLRFPKLKYFQNPNHLGHGPTFKNSTTSPPKISFFLFPETALSPREFCQTYFQN